LHSLHDTIATNTIASFRASFAVQTGDGVTAFFFRSSNIHIRDETWVGVPGMGIQSLSVGVGTWIELRKVNEDADLYEGRGAGFTMTWWWDGNGVYLERMDVMCVYL